jgi:hypothetical protein
VTQVLVPRWDLAMRDGVQSVIKQAVRAEHAARPNTTEIEDLTQDALIMVATTRNLIDAIEPEFQSGLLHHRLKQDLRDANLTEAKNTGNRVSYERLIGDFEE